MQSKIQTLSDEDVDNYIKETESPKADDLKGTTEKVEEKKEDVKEDVSQIAKGTNDKKELQTLSEEDEKILVDAQPTEVKEEKSSKPTKKDIEGSIGYKDIVTFMIDEDGWEPEVELEGGQKVSLKDVPDEEYTPEVYANLLKYQNGIKVAKAIAEEKSQWGGEAEQVIDYLKNNGKIEDIAQYFQATKDIQAIDTETEQGQEEVIREYYKSTTNKSDEWIKEQIETFKDKGADRFKKEAEDNKTALLETIKEQQTETIEQQKQIDSQRKEADQRFNQAIREAIYKDNIPDREKREQDKYRFETKFPHPQNPNVKVSQFWLDFYKIQNDPAKQYKLQQVVRDFDKVENKVKTESKTLQSVHTFLRKNQSTLTKPNSAEPEYSSGTKDRSSLDWDKINQHLKK